MKEMQKDITVTFISDISSCWHIHLYTQQWSGRTWLVWRGNRKQWRGCAGRDEGN